MGIVLVGRGKHISRGGIRPLARNRFSTKHIHSTPVTLAAKTTSPLYPRIDDVGCRMIQGRELSMYLSSRRRRLLLRRGRLSGLGGLFLRLGLLLGGGVASRLGLGAI